jgi:hypothetical protein
VRITGWHAFLSTAPSPEAAVGGGFVDVTGNRGDHGALAEQQAGLEPQRALVVEQLLPPVADDSGMTTVIM